MKSTHFEGFPKETTLATFSKGSEQARIKEQLISLAWGVSSLAAIGFVILAIFTSPIWITLLVFNLPLIGLLGFLVM